MSKSDLYNIVLKWKSEIDDLSKGFNFTKPDKVEEQISTWLYKIRTADKLPLVQPGICVVLSVNFML